MTPRSPVPHGFPFRLVDRLDRDASPGNVTISLSANGFYARGQAWSAPLVAEALAQSIALAQGLGEGARARLVALHGVRLLQHVVTGDRLRVEFREEGGLGNLRRFSCRALRAGAPVAEATVSVAS